MLFIKKIVCAILIGTLLIGLAPADTIALPHASDKEIKFAIQQELKERQKAMTIHRIKNIGMASLYFGGYIVAVLAVCCMFPDYIVLMSFSLIICVYLMLIWYIVVVRGIWDEGSRLNGLNLIKCILYPIENINFAHRLFISKLKRLKIKQENARKNNERIERVNFRDQREGDIDAQAKWERENLKLKVDEVTRYGLIEYMRHSSEIEELNKTQVFIWQYGLERWMKEKAEQKRSDLKKYRLKKLKQEEGSTKAEGSAHPEIQNIFMYHKIKTSSPPPPSYSSFSTETQKIDDINDINNRFPEINTLDITLQSFHITYREKIFTIVDESFTLWAGEKKQFITTMWMNFLIEKIRNTRLISTSDVLQYNLRFLIHLKHAV